jgi:hypothetical protein
MAISNTGCYIFSSEYDDEIATFFVAFKRNDEANPTPG